MGQGPNPNQVLLVLNSEDYFKDVVSDSLRKRRINTPPLVETYLVKLLHHYLDVRNLFDNDVREDGTKSPSTLAETFLLAQNAEHSQKTEMLKKLADRTLYLSGFFGDSLSRKVVDIDYYAQIGGVSYGVLSTLCKESLLANVYETFSARFLDFVDVLHLISESSAVKSDHSVLRLYDRYLRTGSQVAKEKLIELGVAVLPKDQVKLGKPS